MTLCNSAQLRGILERGWRVWLSWAPQPLWRLHSNPTVSTEWLINVFKLHNKYFSSLKLKARLFFFIFKLFRQTCLFREVQIFQNTWMSQKCNSSQRSLQDTAAVGLFCWSWWSQFPVDPESFAHMASHCHCLLKHHPSTVKSYFSTGPMLPP